MKARTLLLCFVGLLWAMQAFGQDSQAARVHVYLLPAEGLKVGQEAQLVIEVQPKASWHVYSAIPSEEGVYRPAEVGYELSSRGFEATPGLQEKGSLTSQMDDVLGGTVRYYKEKVVFSQTINITEPEVAVIGFFDYMACDEFQCIPFTADFEVRAQASE